MPRKGLITIILLTLSLLTGCGTNPMNDPDQAGLYGPDGQPLQGGGGLMPGDGSGIGRPGYGDATDLAGGDSQYEYRDGAYGQGWYGKSDGVYYGTEDPRTTGAMGTDSSAMPAGEPGHKVFFNFNSDGLSDEAKLILSHNAQWIKSRNPTQVTVEGHCDERGTREYNLALGEKRANAVRNYLTTQGVDWNKLRTISYGKEKPMDLGHNERSWAQNRRVELILR